MASNDLEQGLNDSYNGIKDAANSAKNTIRNTKKTVNTAKKAAKNGAKAAKKAKKLFALIPLPIKIYAGSMVLGVIFLGSLLYLTPSIISNTALHQNDPESVSDGKDFTDNKESDVVYKDMQDKAADCREMVIGKLDEGHSAAYNSLAAVASSNGWKLDNTYYSEPPEQTDNRNMALLYSGYSVATKNGLGDEAFKHYQGDSSYNVEGLTAYNDLKNLLEKAKKTSSPSHPYGNLIYGADFERDSNGEIKKTVVKEGNSSVTYVYPIVYDLDIRELIEKGILPDGITLDSPYEETDSITDSANDKSPSTDNSSGDANLINIGTMIGKFKITRYCACSICNGAENAFGKTASGTALTPNVTIAVDPKVIPLGTKVYIEGIGWRIAQDTGGAIKGNRIDLLVSSHAQAMDEGVTYNKVFLAKNTASDIIINPTGATDKAASGGTVSAAAEDAGDTLVTYQTAMEDMATTLGHLLFPNEAWIDSISIDGGYSVGDDGLGNFGAMWYWIQWETGKTDDSAFYSVTLNDGKGGQAYGIQFDLYQGSLQEFMRYCYSKDSKTYAMFQPYLYVSPPSLYAHSTSDTMPTIWKAAYAADPEGFINLQKEYAAANYLQPVISSLESKGYKISSRSDVVKGLFLAWAFQWGPATPPRKLPQIDSAATLNKLSDYDFLKTVYDWRVEHESEYATRYREEERTALALQKQWGTVGTSELSANLANKIVSLAKSGQSFGAGTSQCLVWVQNVYLKAGVKNTYTNICCAGHARWLVAKQQKPKSASQIPIGAAVFSDPKVYTAPYGQGARGRWESDVLNGRREKYGHIGIYIGNGQILSWLGSCVGPDTWESWVSTYGNGGYGFLIKK